MKRKIFEIMPLGGLGEIGSNMILVKDDKSAFIIDAGILFPYEDFFDINYLIPDLNFITQKIEHIVITHGHEDHIGAIRHFVERFPGVNIHANGFAFELIKNKLNEHKLEYKLQKFNNLKPISIDQFEITPFNVNHSIPDTFGLIIKRDKIATIYASDFKVDPVTTYEDQIHFDEINNILKDSEIKMLMLDSTNIEVTNRTPSELDLVEGLDQVIQKEKRTFITLFSSNVHRMKTIFELAKKHKRRVVLIGRSVHSYVDTAVNSNLIEDYKRFNYDQVDNLESPKNLFIVSGCQGDHFSAVRRITSGEHPIKLTEKDQFVFSSKVIPGNYKKVARIYNKIAEAGCELVTAKDHHIHASGHASQHDITEMINQIQPTDYVPIHGESYMINKHTDFVNENWKNITVRPILNYQSITIKEDLVISTFTRPAHDPVLIHGNGIIIEREKISERRKMACNGVVFVSVSNKKITTTFNGLPTLAFREKDRLESVIQDFVNLNSKMDSNKLIEEIRIRVRRFFSPVLGYKPITIVHNL